MTLTEAKIERILRTQLEEFIESLGGKLAYTYTEAAELVGYSDDVLRQAVARGTLRASYANSKPVIRAAELRR